MYVYVIHVKYIHICMHCIGIHIYIIYTQVYIYTYQVSSVAQWCLTLCNPMNRSTPGLPVHHQLPEPTQTHVH